MQKQLSLFSVKSAKHRNNKNIIADGHLLGNHTYSHIDMMKNSKNTIASQIYSTNKIIKEITGTDVNFTGHHMAIISVLL